MQAGKPVALLAYLALAPGCQASKDHVAELFWPGVPLSDARHSLRQANYRIRQATGDTELIRGENSHLEIDGRVHLDSLQAEAALEANDLRRAHQLLREGDFLADISLDGCRELERWVEAQRIRFRDCRARVTRRLAEWHLERGEWDMALLFAEELLTVRPFDDWAMELVMRAIAGRGKHATALARFHAFEEILAAELEAEPEERLAAYARELDVHLTAKPERSATELPLVGRASAWSALETGWDGTRRGRGAIVLVEGAAGFGKSRLLRELHRWTTNGDALILDAKCYEIESGVPYSTVAEAFSTVVAEPEMAAVDPVCRAELARVLPTLRERFPDLPRPEDETYRPAARQRLHEAFAHTTERLSGERRILISIDDVQWADAESLGLLHLLCHRLQESRTLLVATYRPAELSPAARRFARSVLSSGAASLITLEPLTFDEVRELVRTMARFDDAAGEQLLVHELRRHTAGNPLHLSELLEALSRERVVWIRNGRWQVDAGPGIDALPRTLSKLLIDRIESLPNGMKSILETLAVVGDEAEVETLAGALALSEPKTVLALNVLEEERLVRRVREGTFELVHDEVRHLVYGGIPDARRALLHGAVARALKARGEERRPGGPARLAFHFDQAGLADETQRYAILAADEADAFSAEKSARQHLELAASHSARALPPPAMPRPEPRGSARRGLLRPRTLSIAAGVIVVGVLIGAAIGRTYWAPADGVRSPLPYEQGTLFLSEAPGRITHFLDWPPSVTQAGKIVELRRPPTDLPAGLVSRNVTVNGASHPKLFKIEGADTVQLTFGEEDDYGGSWSPDGRFVAVNRGWRAGDLYPANIVLIDAATGQLVKRVTDTRWQDQFGGWSPSGGSIAFSRDSAGATTFWIADVDGSNAQNLSDRFDLPAVRGSPSFSPDGRRLAILFPNTGHGTGSLYVVDLEAGGSYRPATPARPFSGRPVWSPDSRWVAYSGFGDSRWEVWLSDAIGSAAPRILARSPTRFQLARWTDGVERHAARIDIQLPGVELSTGAAMRAVARALTPAGAEIDARFRWSVLDPAVATVDDLGFLRGRVPGRTALVASIGGLLADTVRITVHGASVDTLLHEDWSAGLDTSVWTPFGIPHPFVTTAPDGRRALVNNGDYNHTSGVYSTQGFRIGAAGVTLEVDARVSFDGGFWQFIDVAFIARPPEGAVEVSGGQVRLNIHGATPNESVPWWACGPGGARGELNLAEVNEAWRAYAVQLRPDGYMECWMNGRLLARAPLPAELTERPLFIYLDGQMENTELYHARVLVTRGLRN